jgi:hypothetical protein
MRVDGMGTDMSPRAKDSTHQEPKHDGRSLSGIAVAIARSAPAKANTYAYSANIPWHLINELRTYLDQRGIEWRDSQ